jgi:hypothetical protein
MLNVVLCNYLSLSLMPQSDNAGGRPTYWKQGVKLLRSPIEVGVAGAQRKSRLPSFDSLSEESANSLVTVAGLFDSCNGDLSVTVTFA